MSHELSFINGHAEFAFLTGTPVWHGFGQEVPAVHADSLDYWLQASNMGNWHIKSAPVLGYDLDDDEIISMPDRKILYRSDTKLPLADVGANFNVVQPREVVDFFRKLIAEMGFKMVTCGVLFGGKRLWAQADIGEAVSILGQEKVEGRLLLTTANDGSSKTRAQYTQVCVVCNNTLRAALGQGKEMVELSHAGVFNPDDMHEALELRHGAALEWQKLAEKMAQYKLNSRQAAVLFDYAFNSVQLPVAQADVPEADEDAIEAEYEPAGNVKAIERCIELFDGNKEFIGGDLSGRQGTLWGAVNCVTQFIDHERPTKSMDARIERAYWGDGANIKSRAWEGALDLAA